MNHFLRISSIALSLICPLYGFANTFQTQQWQTKNGTEVVFYQAMEVPMLEVSIAFRAGSAYDEVFGQSALTTRLLDQGNQGLSADVIADKLAQTGAQFEAAATQDMVALNLKTVTEPVALKEAVDVFTLIVAHPDFPADSLEHEKQQQIMSIAHSKESPDDVANQTFFEALYQQHPYAHPVNGTEESVRTLTKAHVEHFYQTFFVARNAVIVLVGAIDRANAERIAEKIAMSLASGQPAPMPPLAKALTKQEQRILSFPSSQTILRIGQLGITHHDKDYFPLVVGNYILGGGSLVSRLAYEVRETRGLTYGVYSQFAPMPGIGPFIIGLSTKQDQTNTAIEVTQNTLSAFLKQGPSQKELLAAKQFLTGSFPLSLASNRSIADMLLKIAFYQLPKDYLNTYIEHIQAVSVEDIKRAFDGHIHANDWLQVRVGPA